MADLRASGGVFRAREWVYDGDPFIAEWLGSVSVETKGHYTSKIEAFLEWVEAGNSKLELGGYEGSLPRRLLLLQKDLNRDGEGRKKILRAAYAYVKERGAERGWRSSYRANNLSAIRSFFVYHLDETGFPKESKRRMAHVLKSDVKKVRKNLSLVELREVAIRSSPMYRTVLKCMFGSGMGEDEVVKFSNQGMAALQEAMEDPVADGVIEVYLGARKHNIDGDFYVYIGGGAYRELRSWLKVRKGLEERFNDPDLVERRLRDRRAAKVDEFPDSVFVTNIFSPLSTNGLYNYFHRKMEQLGFIHIPRENNNSRGRVKNGSSGNRYNKNPHQIRSLFRTQWSKSRVNPDVGEYFMGHVVDSLDYNKVADDREYRIAEYRKAVHYLDLENERTFGKVDEAEVESLSQQVRDLEARLRTERLEKDRRDEEFRLLADQMKEMMPEVRKMIDRERKLDRLKAVA